MSKEQIRTPIGRARGLGSAHDGVHHWWAQRVSGILLLPLTIYLGFHLGDLTGGGEFGHIAVMAAIGDPITSIALILFVMTAFYHASLGVRVVVEDYVHCAIAKPLLLVFNTCFFFMLGAACIFSILFIDFMLLRG